MGKVIEEYYCGGCGRMDCVMGGIIVVVERSWEGMSVERLLDWLFDCGMKEGRFIACGLLIIYLKRLG